MGLAARPSRRGRYPRDETGIEITPRGPFSLAAAQDFAGGFPAGIGGGGVGPGSITLAFPVEGRDASVAIELWQDADGVVRGRTDAAGAILDVATRQAARSLSRIRGSSRRLHIAKLVDGSEVRGAVVGVAEVPCLVGADRDRKSVV